MTPAERFRAITRLLAAGLLHLRDHPAIPADPREHPAPEKPPKKLPELP
jgi:hypothetical protein